MTVASAAEGNQQIVQTVSIGHPLPPNGFDGSAYLVDVIQTYLFPPGLPCHFRLGGSSDVAVSVQACQFHHCHFHSSVTSISPGKRGNKVDLMNI